MIRCFVSPGAGILLLAGSIAATSSLAEDKPPKKPPFVSKMAIERPTEALLAGKNQPIPPASAISRVMADPSSGPVPQPRMASSDTFMNPKVAPGKVRWHADFAVACEAAKKTGKPVLLFHMMGKLDDQFC
jgi:hypothetical protein